MVDFLSRLEGAWIFINSNDFAYFSTWLGIWTATVFFLGFGLTMAGLLVLHRPPRPQLDAGWTWVVLATAGILIRVMYTRFYGAPAELWGALLWWNLILAIVYTSVYYVGTNVRGLVAARRERRYGKWRGGGDR